MPSSLSSTKYLAPTSAQMRHLHRRSCLYRLSLSIKAVKLVVRGIVTLLWTRRGSILLRRRKRRRRKGYKACDGEDGEDIKAYEGRRAEGRVSTEAKTTVATEVMSKTQKSTAVMTAKKKRRRRRRHKIRRWLERRIRRTESDRGCGLKVIYGSCGGGGEYGDSDERKIKAPSCSINGRDGGTHCGRSGGIRLGSGLGVGSGCLLQLFMLLRRRWCGPSVFFRKRQQDVEGQVCLRTCGDER